MVAENRIETGGGRRGDRARVPAVPINPSSGTAELAHIVADAAPEMLLTAPGTEPPPALAGPGRWSSRSRRGHARPGTPADRPPGAR